MIFERRLKAERDGNILWVPYPLGLKERFNALRTGIDFLLTRKIDVHNEDGTWSEDQPFDAEMRIGSFVSSVETFILGYRYRMIDLNKAEDYQALKFIEEIEAIEDLATRDIVVAQLKAGTWNEDR